MDIDKKNIKIYIVGNKNTDIHNNKVEITLPRESKALEYFVRNRLNKRDIQEILEETRVIESVYERERLLVQKLEMVRALYERRQEILVIRFWGMYSGFSTIRTFYDKSEMASLEWDEKRILIDLVKKGFPVRMILTLNINKVLSFGYTINDIWQRIEDMCEVCFDLARYDNFEFVIDEDKDIDSTIAIDGLFMMKQYDFANESFNYKKSFWTSDLRKIKEFCYEFETRYNELEKNYYQTKQIFSFDNYQEYIKLVMQSRINKRVTGNAI